MADVEVLIATRDRPLALAATLASLIGQTLRRFDIIISDQSADSTALHHPTIQTTIRVLRLRGHLVTVHRHLPARGLAEQRQYLLDQATAPAVLSLDDDVILEPWVLRHLVSALRTQSCGFIGQAVVGLSYQHNIRPRQQAIEFWDSPVRPERITPDSPAWQRHQLHNAANLLHAAAAHHITPAHPRLYKVAWIGGCILYDTTRLRAVGGYQFWRDLPPHHAGEDVVVQLRLQERYGGAGLIPSGAYHQELPTTVPEPRFSAPHHLYRQGVLYQKPPSLSGQLRYDVDKH